MNKLIRQPLFSIFALLFLLVAVVMLLYVPVRLNENAFGYRVIISLQATTVDVPRLVLQFLAAFTLFSLTYFAIITLSAPFKGFLTSNNYFKRCWRGEEKFWKAFWVYGLPTNLAVLAVFYAAAWMLGSSEEPNGLVLMASILLSIPAYFWWLTSSWRCANNRNSITHSIARVLILAVYIPSLFAVIKVALWFVGALAQSIQPLP